MNLFARFVGFRLHSLRPWRRGFVATTALAAILFGAVQLWNAGSAEWAFALAFTATWLLISSLWSNDDFIEESSLIFADCVDRNFEDICERLHRIESELDQGRNQAVARPDAVQK